MEKTWWLVIIEDPRTEEQTAVHVLAFDAQSARLAVAPYRVVEVAELRGGDDE